MFLAVFFYRQPIVQFLAVGVLGAGAPIEPFSSCVNISLLFPICTFWPFAFRLLFCLVLRLQVVPQFFLLVLFPLAPRAA